MGAPHAARKRDSERVQQGSVSWDLGLRSHSVQLYICSAPLEAVYTCLGIMNKNKFQGHVKARVHKNSMKAKGCSNNYSKRHNDTVVLL
eukprot:5545337-Amphidinium_carterae.1